MVVVLVVVVLVVVVAAVVVVVVNAAVVVGASVRRHRFCRRWAPLTVISAWQRDRGVLRLQ